MEAASKGAADNGGTVVGILPESDRSGVNPYVNVVIPTGLGLARNTVVVTASDVLIAFPGSYGTLSEIGFAMNLGKAVIYMPGSWDIGRIANIDGRLFKEALDPNQAIGLALTSV